MIKFNKENFPFFATFDQLLENDDAFAQLTLNSVDALINYFMSHSSIYYSISYNQQLILNLLYVLAVGLRYFIVADLSTAQGAKELMDAESIAAIMYFLMIILVKLYLSDISFYALYELMETKDPLYNQLIPTIIERCYDMAEKSLPNAIPSCLA
jgi:hypothetical protein